MEEGVLTFGRMTLRSLCRQKVGRLGLTRQFRSSGKGGAGGQVDMTWGNIRFR